MSMARPAGHLDELRAAVERLAGAFARFLDRASDDEVAAVRQALSGPPSHQVSDHVVHDHVALWTLDRVIEHRQTNDRSVAAAPAFDIDHLWHVIEALLKSLIDDLLHGAIDPAGTIFGYEKYEVFDTEWLEYIEGWLEYSPLSGKIAKLPTGGVEVAIPDDVTIAVVGDWGTGTDYSTESASLVAAAIGARSPDYTVHLGDVYYAGAAQQRNFLDPWPPAAGASGSFALNSNHDMYDGANAYLDVTLADQTFFALQGGKTHFALHNTNWVVVGLDTAGPASWKRRYMDGDLDDDQLAFLGEQASTGKRLVLLTHHHGLQAVSGEPNDPLHAKVVDCVMSSRSGELPWYWYWGHLHAGYAHTDDAAVFRGRCAGHGAIPWGHAWGITAAPSIDWCETTPSTIGTRRVVNGFSLLTLAGDSLMEQFVDETGRVSHTIGG